MSEILDDQFTVDRLLRRATGSDDPRPAPLDLRARLRHVLWRDLDLLPVGVLAASSCVAASLEFGYLFH